MKESIGMAWIFTIVVTFIMLFTGYIAISVNYAKAFKIKDNIVSKIEENTNRNGFPSQLESDITNYLISEGYGARGKCPTAGDYGFDSVRTILGNENSAGVCVYSKKLPDEIKNDTIDTGRCYYKVVTFFKFELPIVSFLTTFKVSGDTKVIYLDDINGTC